MSKIIGLAGVRGAGRTTFRNYVYHKVLTMLGNECWLRPDGLIGIPIDDESSGAVDPDHTFGSSAYMVEKVYPIFHGFALRDSLKFFANQFYGLSIDKLYGTETDLQSMTFYTIGDIYTKAPAGRPQKQTVSYLEFMEKLESTILKINPSALHNALGNTLLGEESKLVLVTDIESQADVDFINNFGDSYVYHITRNPYNLKSSLGNVPESDFVDIIDNYNMDMATFHDILFNKLVSLGVFD